MNEQQRLDLVERLAEHVIEGSDWDHLWLLARSAMIMVYKEKTAEELVHYVRTVAPSLLDKEELENDQTAL